MLQTFHSRESLLQIKLFIIILIVNLSFIFLTKGVPGVDYPILSLEDMPSVAAQSEFSCQDRENGGKNRVVFRG